MYESALKDTNNANPADKVNSLTLTTPESWYWTVESAMGIYDISKPFDYDPNDDVYSLKYTGKDFTGEKLIIRSVCQNTNYLYVFEDNKAYKINDKDLEEGSSSDNCF